MTKQREIKFRAWNKTTKEMENDVHKSHVWKLAIQTNDCRILMQYTGLKDKNGKEIYEGDIVKFGKNMYSPFENSIAEVEWFEANLKYILKKKHIKKDDKDPLVLDIEDLGNASGGVGEMPEIIGNIYENPKLLKQND